MTVSAAYPKKCTLFDSHVRSNHSFSVPFSFKCFFTGEKNALKFSDLSIPWSGEVAKAEIQTIVLNPEIKTCIIVVQLLDNSGRIVSVPFPVACTTGNTIHIQTRIELQEFQRIRFFLLNVNKKNVTDILVIGKYILSHGSVMPSKGLRRKIIKQNKRRNSLKLFYNNII